MGVVGCVFDTVDAVVDVVVAGDVPVVVAGGVLFPCGVRGDAVARGGNDPSGRGDITGCVGVRLRAWLGVTAAATACDVGDATAVVGDVG